jgi:hypothetical protein
MAPQLRSMHVVFSPFLAQGECTYVVEQTGVRGLLPEEVLRAQWPAAPATVPAAAPTGGPPEMPATTA